MTKDKIIKLHKERKGFLTKLTDDTRVSMDMWLKQNNVIEFNAKLLDNQDVSDRLFNRIINSIISRVEPNGISGGMLKDIDNYNWGLNILYSSQKVINTYDLKALIKYKFGELNDKR